MSESEPAERRPEQRRQPDIAVALEKYLRRKNLPWDETAKEVIKHNPTDLGKISKAIRAWIQEHENKGVGMNKLNQGQLAAAIAGKFNLQLTETGDWFRDFLRQSAEDAGRAAGVPYAESFRRITTGA